jgi:hypothetical protein
MSNEHRPARVEDVHELLLVTAIGTLFPSNSPPQ